ncbi:Coiled-coil domain-containing protein 12 [Phytophthora nicotianae]|uniref:Coiled-coil domain-containing protein 12 n=1 Tax=Phytophthora nicotianae TaxID=4792 RepID=A0A0W8DWY1_PHYNI|nr:Coiled-coil domain-containing protein 12 [Phytophthora nicotianae]
MASTDADDSMPRAKRLKMLREAKARKERGESNGETGALVAAVLRPADDEPKRLEDAPHLEDQEEDVKMANASEKSDGKSADLVEKVAQVQEEDAKTEDESDDDLLNLAPKRANWDMERDIAPMLRKLERRTQHAIVEILRTLKYSYLVAVRI